MGGKTSYNRNRNDNDIAQSLSPVCSNSFTSQNQLPSHDTDTASPSTSQKSDYDYGQSELFRSYLKQIREEMSGRLLSCACRSNGMPNKWWLAFAKRKFMNIIVPESATSNLRKSGGYIR